jgi:hypothetical protein
MTEVLVPLGFFGLVAYMVHAIVSGILRAKMISKQSQVLIRLVESAGPAAATAGFSESPVGRALLEGQVDRRTLMLQRVLSAVQAFIVLTAGGLSLLLIRMRVAGDDERATLWMMALLAIALGLAYLLAAAATFALSSRWGLLETRARELPGGL